MHLPTQNPRQGRVTAAPERARPVPAAPRNQPRMGTREAAPRDPRPPRLTRAPGQEAGGPLRPRGAHSHEAGAARHQDPLLEHRRRRGVRPPRHRPRFTAPAPRSLSRTAARAWHGPVGFTGRVAAPARGSSKDRLPRSPRGSKSGLVTLSEVADSGVGAACAKGQYFPSTFSAD